MRLGGVPVGGEAVLRCMVGLLLGLKRVPERGVSVPDFMSSRQPGTSECLPHGRVETDWLLDV